MYATTRATASAALGVALASLLGLAPRSARADDEPPHHDTFHAMDELARRGVHDPMNEAWNAYAQFTYISSWKLAFQAPYTNLGGSPNSLLPDAERSFTGSFTLFLGAKLWPGGEAYFVPEVISLRPLSGLHGLGSVIQNTELQKSGVETPQLYRSRAYLQQTIGLGGGKLERSSDPMQLGGSVDKHRIALRLGSFSVLDFLDPSSFSKDGRQQFINMAFMTYAAYDFEADARGYAWGLEAELDWDDWALRFARMTPPQDPNSLPLDLRFWEYFGDQLEIEHTHTLFGKQGAIRVLGYRNRQHTGNFEDAIAAFRADPSKNAASCVDYNYGSSNANAPDLCWARKANIKAGIGLNLEQHLTDDIGVFFRGMYSDGESEVYAFTSTDRSIAFGALGKGSLWHRPLDVTGVGIGLGWASSQHVDYLKLGGVDGFIGDGALTPGTESVVELFYSVNLFGAPIWLTADYQHIANPGFNKDRGPVEIFGGRIHAEL